MKRPSIQPTWLKLALRADNATIAILGVRVGKESKARQEAERAAGDREAFVVNLMDGADLTGRRIRAWLTGHGWPQEDVDETVRDIARAMEDVLRRKR